MAFHFIPVWNRTRWTTQFQASRIMGIQQFYGKGPHPTLWAGSRAAREETTIQGTPNHVIYRVLFRTCTSFMNVASVRIFCSSRVQNPCCTWHFLFIFIANYDISLKFWGTRGGAVGWGTALQPTRSRIRFPMVSLEFYIDIILPTALQPWGWLSLYQKWVPGISPGG